jgi:hypothetical protein
MPLRDHFRPPLDDRRRWDSLHAGWPMVIAIDLRRKLPRRYFTALHVHPGTSVEIDVATFEDEAEAGFTPVGGNGNGGVAVPRFASWGEVGEGGRGGGFATRRTIEDSAPATLVPFFPGISVTRY